VGPQPPPRASLSIDTTALGEAAEVLRDRIFLRGEGVLRQHDVLPARSDDDLEIMVVVVPLPEETTGYRATYQAQRSGDVVEGTAWTSECRLCTEAELVEQVEAGIVRVVGRLGPAAVSDTSSPPPARPVASEDLHPAEDAPRWSPVGRAGLGVSIPGAALLGIGIGLAAHRISPGEHRWRAPTRIAGLALAGVGLGAVVTGVALLIAEGRGARKAKRALAPMMGPDRAGVEWFGRF
jgi:hypothetical protein